MVVVRCNVCGKWIGSENQIRKFDMTEFCPICNASGGLMDLDAECSFSEDEIVVLWSLFEDVSINDNDEIEEEFLGFPAGTDRFEIWHWFDERYSGGVAKLSGVT